LLRRAPVYIYWAMAKLLQTKRVIQHKETKLYFKSDGTWTKKLDRAAHIKSLADAVNTCEAHDLRSVELVLKFEKSEYNDRCDVSLSALSKSIDAAHEGDP